LNEGGVMFEIGTEVKLTAPHGKLDVDDGRKQPIPNGSLGTVVERFGDGFVGKEGAGR
jgi:hypothetical protein